MMFSTLIGVLAGFVGGVLYSRGKADPLQAAWFDLRRTARATGRVIGNLARWITRRAKAINCKTE